MDPITLAAIMAGVGMVKGATVDKDNEKRDALLQSEITRYSPWTHMTGKDPKRADPLGNAMQFGATGLALGQNNEAFGKDQLLRDKVLRSPYTPNVNLDSGSNLTQQWNSPQNMFGNRGLWGTGYNG